MKRAVYLCFIFSALFIFSSNLALADGGVVTPKAKVTTKVGKHVSLPSQKAAIAWNGETETLILSTKIKGEDLENLAWITPIPSKAEPLVQKSDAGIFKDIGRLFSEIKIEYVGGKGPGGGVTLIFLIFLLLSLFFFVFGISRRENKKIMIPCLLLATIFFFAFLLFPAFFMGTMGTAGVKGRKGKVVPLKVVKSKKVGIYDVLVLKANNSTYMVNWLKDRGYQVSDKSIPVLEDYCRREDFYFVVNRVDVEDLSDKRKAEIRKDFAEGSATPLKIRFKPDRPYYPMKMSSINTGETTINVYFFSTAPVRDKSDTLEIKSSRDVMNMKNLLSDKKDIEINLPYQYQTSTATWLQYKGNLSQLNKDVYFVSDNTTCHQLPTAELSPEVREVSKAKISRKDCRCRLAILEENLTMVKNIRKRPVRLKPPVFECYYELGEAKPSLCDKVTGEKYFKERHLKDSCYFGAAISTKNTSFCTKISLDSGLHFNCYKKLADLTGSLKVRENPSICGERFGGFAAGECYADFAFLENRPSICRGLEDEYTRKICYSEIGERVKNPALCEKMENDKRKDKCYTDVVYNNLSVTSLSICKKIEGQKEKDQCYKYMARNRDDTSLCEKIKDESTKKTCQRYY